jgi:phenylalanyl-tRNA synthetase beta chain
MRTTIAGSLLETIAYNLNRKNKNNRLFEIGKVFSPDPRSDLAIEKDILAIAIEGSCFPQSWGNAELANDFFVLKGILEAFVTNCGLGKLSVSMLGTTPPPHAAMFAPECAAVAVNGNVAITGMMGRISDKVCKAFGIKSTVYYAGLDVTGWISAPKPLAKYDPLPKFPALERDFSFVMPEGLSSETVTKEISSVSGLIKNVRPFDVYRGEKLGASTKSVTFSVEFRSPDKTLTDEDVADACGKIVAVMGKKHGATLRT